MEKAETVTQQENRKREVERELAIQTDISLHRKDGFNEKGGIEKRYGMGEWMRWGHSVTK